MLNKNIFTLDEQELLERYMPTPDAHGQEWWYWHGSNSVCLVAHIDTVQPRTTKPKRLSSGVWIVEDDKGVLGADDRAGFWACRQLKTEFPDLKILLTSGEETGGTGAFECLFDPPDGLLEAKLLIEFDRRGRNEAVFYNNPPSWLSGLIEDLGFEIEHGTFSDVAILSDLGMPHVNISAGYLREHTHKEILIEDFLMESIDKVRDLLSLGDIEMWITPDELEQEVFTMDYEYFSHGWSFIPWDEE